jgi:hypothetical protein
VCSSRSILREVGLPSDPSVPRSDACRSLPPPPWPMDGAPGASGASGASGVDDSAKRASVVSWAADGSILVHDGGRRGLIMLGSGQYEPFPQWSKLRHDAGGSRRVAEAAEAGIPQSDRDSDPDKLASYSEWAAGGGSSTSGRAREDRSDATGFRVAASLWSEMDAVRGATSVVAYHPTVLTHCILGGQVCTFAPAMCLIFRRDTVCAASQGAVARWQGACKVAAVASAFQPPAHASSSFV